jgi:NADPH:quinone reductase-like Zn-dependent oxidoreductase
MSVADSCELLPDATGDGPVPLGPGQVRVGLRAAGVDVRNVLIMLGKDQEDPGRIGLEGAGVVLGTGSGVTGMAAGDAVMGLFAGEFATTAVTDARLLAPVPFAWSVAQAAATPVAFLTAYYALVELADLGPGRSVLIHAAATRVGMAAVRLARHLGAEVFGTASPSKRDTLRGLGLDDAHIGSSRTADLEEWLRSATGGTGVDVTVGGPLVSKFVDTSLRLTKPEGRVIQLCGAEAGQGTDADDLAYQAFDLAALGPDRIAAMFAELNRLFADGKLAPLPVMCWDVQRATDAFVYLSQADDNCKVVLTIPVPPQNRAVLVAGS